MLQPRLRSYPRGGMADRRVRAWCVAELDGEGEGAGGGKGGEGAEGGAEAGEERAELGVEVYEGCWGASMVEGGRVCGGIGGCGGVWGWIGDWEAGGLIGG